MNNIESQIRNLRNEEEPYVGMSLGVRDYEDYEDYNDYTANNYQENDCQKCPKPEFKKPEHMKPGCVESTCDGVDVCPLAMAYVPWQVWCKTYKPAEAHHRGTIFPELDLPWVGGGAL